MLNPRQPRHSAEVEAGPQPKIGPQPTRATTGATTGATTRATTGATTRATTGATTGAIRFDGQPAIDPPARPRPKIGPQPTRSKR